MSTDPTLPMFPKPAHAMGPSEFSPDQERDRLAQWVALKAAAPMQARTDQNDTTECPLFQAVDQGRLL